MLWSELSFIIPWKCGQCIHPYGGSQMGHPSHPTTRRTCGCSPGCKTGNPWFATTPVRLIWGWVSWHGSHLETAYTYIQTANRYSSYNESTSYENSSIVKHVSNPTLRLQTWRTERMNVLATVRFPSKFKLPKSIRLVFNERQTYFMACFVYYYLFCICCFLLETNETDFTSLPKNIQDDMLSTLGSTGLTINYILEK